MNRQKAIERMAEAIVTDGSLSTFICADATAALDALLDILDEEEGGIYTRIEAATRLPSLNKINLREKE